MKAFLTLMTSCLALVTVGIVVLLTWQSRVNRQLVGDNSQLSRELRQSQDTVATLTAEKTGISDKLAALEHREKELRDRVDSLEEATEAPPRPYRVRTFVGRENIGEAWMVPVNVTRDTQSGRYLFEPVLVIDESARDHFTAYRTNVVEREVYTTEVYQDGYDYPYVYYATPGRPGGTNRPPYRPGRPTRPEAPAPSASPQPNARAQVFAPPMSIVNSRPQVVGTPATSPINQRVFAP